MNHVSDLIRRGAAALQAGDLPTAHALLIEATARDPQNVQAWLWLSGAAPSVAERRSCLEQVLQLDPDHVAAKRGLALLPPVPSAPVAPVIAPLPVQYVAVAPPKKKRSGGAAGVLLLLIVLSCVGIGWMNSRQTSSAAANTATANISTKDAVPTAAQAYARQIQLPIAQATGALDELGTLFGAARVQDDEWRLDVAVQLALIKDAYQQLQAVENVPTDMRAIHATVLSGMTACNEATTYIATGIDELDASSLQFGATTLKACGTKMTEAGHQLSAYRSKYQ